MPTRPNKIEIKTKLLEIMLLGSSVDRLNKVGSGQREEEYYTKVGKHLDLKIFGYSHSSGITAQYEHKILFKNKWIQSIVGPFFYFKCKWRPDIIRTKQFWGSWSGWIVKIITGAPLVIRCGYIWSKSFEIERRGRWMRGRSIPGFIEKWMIRRGDAFIFSCEEVASFYSPLVRGRKFIIVPNMFNLDIFKPDKVEPLLYDYLYIGRLIELKGVSEMMNRIPESKKLLVIGSGELEEVVSTYPGVIIIPKVKNYELPKYINQAKCFLSLSYTEGHPKAAYESVLCGAYPILSNIPAHKALIDKLGYGALINKGDPVPDNSSLHVNFDKLDRFRMEYNMPIGVEKEVRFLNKVISCYSKTRF
jgi:glycosyltransferase involved in cell wall biosynthesis